MNLNEKIEELIEQPQSVSVDGQSVTTRSVDELIQADQYLASKKVGETHSAWKCLRIARVKPPRPN